MNCAVTACDASPMTVEQFAASTAGFSEHHWAGLRLHLLPGTVTGRATYDLPRLWQSLASDAGAAEAEPLPTPHSVMVWREGEAPVFVLTPEAEGHCLQAIASGVTFGEMCDWLSSRSDPETSALEAGSMLRHWLELGLIQHIEASPL